MVNTDPMRCLPLLKVQDLGTVNLLVGVLFPRPLYLDAVLWVLLVSLTPAEDGEEKVWPTTEAQKKNAAPSCAPCSQAYESSELRSLGGPQSLQSFCYPCACL